MPRNFNKAAALALVLLLIGGAVFIYKPWQRTGSLASQSLRLNVDYVQAENLYTEKRYGEALASYQAALARTKKINEEIFLKLKIAEMMRGSGRNLEAVDYLKEIATNSRYTDVSPEVTEARAYSLVVLASIYNSTRDPAVAARTFSGDFWRDFLKAEDGNRIDIAYRRMAEYAVVSSPQPDLVAIAQVARWYALEIRYLQYDGETPEEKALIQDYTDKARSALAFIDSRLEDRTSYYNNWQQHVQPTVMRLKAVIVSILIDAGEDSLPDPEEIFKQAVALPQPSWMKVQAEFSYAIYLADRYGAERRDDIGNLLASFYTASSTEFNSQEWIASQKANPSPTTARQLRLLADIDPQFSAFLQNAGW